jgi:hypothetical protein
MPTHCLDPTVPKSTPRSSPVEAELEVREGVVVRWSVLIPAPYGLEPDHKQDPPGGLI